MHENQLEFLIDNLKENEDKTSEIAQALYAFNDTVGGLVRNMGILIESKTMKEGADHLKDLTSHLAGIEQRLVGLEPSKVTLSESTIMYKDKLLVVGTDRAHLYEYDLENQSTTSKYSLNYKVKVIFAIANKLYALSEVGEVYSVGIQSSFLENIEEVKVCPLGIIYKDKEHNLMFQPLLGEMHKLATEIQHFEIVKDRYLVYTSKSGEGATGQDWIKHIDLAEL